MRVRFRARFGAAVTHDVMVPIAAVLGIYARETGQGMIFSRRTPPPPTATNCADRGSRLAARNPK